MAGGDAGSARSDGLIRSLSDHGRDSLQVCRRTSRADISPSRWPRGDLVRTVAEEYDRVVGVDTHAATHTMSLLIAATDAVVEHRNFPTSAAGLRRALTWIGNRTQDQACLVVVEGTGSYGAQLTEHFTQGGIVVAEAPTLPP
jgi:Transposase